MKTIKPLLLVAVLCLAGNPVWSASQKDRTIESAIRQSHVFQSHLKEDSINIQSKDGDVVLDGTVSDETHKSLAEEIAKDQPGVTRVTNNIQVTGSTYAAAGGISDTWIKNKIQANLLFHRNVSAARTDVEVIDGIVTLRGEADSQAQKDLTAEYAEDVAGVQKVHNEIKVVSASKAEEQKTLGEKIDDASITAQVKMMLLYNRSTSALNTQVNTQDGVVIVTGKAASEAEKDLVTKRVSSVRGVREVVNKMQVEVSGKS